MVSISIEKLLFTERQETPSVVKTGQFILQGKVMENLIISLQFIP